MSETSAFLAAIFFALLGFTLYAFADSSSGTSFDEHDDKEPITYDEDEFD